MWYLDDGTIIGPRSAVAAFVEQISRFGPDYGLFLNLSKCEVFWPCGDFSFPEFPEEFLRPTEGISLLGSPLWGEESFYQEVVDSTIAKTLSLQSSILELEDAQVEMHLLRSCLSVCKVNHLLRTTPRFFIEEQLHKFDRGLRSTLADIIRSPISDLSWSQATLPFRFGGLGLRESFTTAAAAFTASANTSKHLGDVFLSNGDPPSSGPSQFAFPGELHCQSLLQCQLDTAALGKDLSLYSQHSLGLHVILCCSVLLGSLWQGQVVHPCWQQ